MRKIEIGLYADENRPIFDIETEIDIADCLLDTDYYTFISDFGSGYHTASIWKIPEIILSDRRKKTG